MRRSIVIVGLLLAGCGGGTEHKVRNPETGEVATVRTDGGDKSGIAVPANLPGFAAIYPGARIETSVTGSADEAKGMVSFTVDAPMDRLIAFYREKGTAAGLKVVAEANMGTARMLSMGREGTSDAAMQVTVTPQEEEARTQATIVYSVEGG